MHTRSQTSSETRYPRTYQMDRKTSRVVTRIAMFIFGFFVLLTIIDMTGVISNAPSWAELLLYNAVFLLLLIAGFWQWDRKVILYEDAIEVKGWFSARTLQRNEILGRRMVTGGYPARISRYVITPTPGNGRKLTLPPFLHVDEVFYSWMKTVPRATD